jgi:hypothetical protein
MLLIFITRKEGFFMVTTKIVVPCINLDCSGEVAFSGDLRQTAFGYNVLMHTKGERCSVCGKKMRLEVTEAIGPFGFQISALPPL